MYENNLYLKNVNKKNHTRKLYLIKNHLIKFISLFILLLICLNMTINYVFMHKVYVEQLEKSNDNIIEQVAIAYEMILKQIKDSVYQTILYDNELTQIISNYRSSRVNQREMVQKLDSLMLNNEYLHSSYLYFPDFDQLYNTVDGRIYTIDNFYDKEVFKSISDSNIYVLDPRIVDFVNATMKKQFIISLVSSVPLQAKTQKCIFVVNIDARKLYYDILKKIKAQDNMNLYVYNSNLETIINKDEAALFQKIDSRSLDKKISYNGFLGSILKKDFSMISTYYSKPLKWNFVLETTIRSSESFLNKLYTFLTYSVFLLIFSLPLIIAVINYYTKPMKDIITDYSEKIWKDFLTDNICNIDEFIDQLKEGYPNTYEGRFGTFVLNFAEQDLSENVLSRFILDIQSSIKTLSEGEFQYKILAANKNTIAAILLFNKNVSSERCASLLLKCAQLVSEKLYNHQTFYIGISTIKEGFTQLPMSYKECLQTFRHKLSLNSSILEYSLIKEQNPKYEYPYAIEKQLINNLLSSNTASTKALVGDFIDFLTSTENNLEDNEIKNNIYQLQNSILRNISDLHIPANTNLELKIIHLENLQEIYVSLCSFLDKILEQITKKSEDEKCSADDKIMNYIDAHYNSEDINLNIVADTLGMNRAVVSKIIKERTGDSFTSYINTKRVLLAKKLLADKNKSIDDIAHDVGFNYSYYFIKIFKASEGITPGQYRNNILQE
jgi:AraC-like DNA-binding protein